MADYDNCHQLHGEVDWRTPAERFHGTSFTGRVVASMPALAAVADILGAIRAA